MSNKKYLHQAVAAAFFAASGACNLAFAVDQHEPNDTIETARPVVVGTTGSVTVTGAIGHDVLGPLPVADIDFFSFEGKQGDLVTVNIDNGVKSSTTERSVDTVLAVFGPLPSTSILRQENDGSPVDFPGSVHMQDARIHNPPVLLPADGTYVVGVSSNPRTFRPGGTVNNPTLLGSRANGSYVLIVSGVTPPQPLVQYININVKPGSDDLAPINPKAKGNIPVALLSARATAAAPAFDALKVKVDRESLTFGRTGAEKSLRRCAKEGTDVNGDGLLDLVCHFDNEAANFLATSTDGTIKGLFTDSAGKERPLEGAAFLKVVPKSED
jgi:hypothetical protein